VWNAILLSCCQGLFLGASDFESQAGSCLQLISKVTLEVEVNFCKSRGVGSTRRVLQNSTNRLNIVTSQFSKIAQE
jgi:hypothetical protein